MDSYKNETVCRMLRKWMKERKITQTVLSTRLGISQSLLSRQLLGKEKIPLDRINDIISILQPPADEISSIFRILGNDYGKDRCFAELHDFINKIGPDPLLNHLLGIWMDLSEEEKKIIEKIVFGAEERIHERGDLLQREKAPIEIQQMMKRVIDLPLPLRKAFFALMDYVMATPRESSPSNELKKMYDEEDSIIKTYGADNLMKMFGLMVSSAPSPRDTENH